MSRPFVSFSEKTRNLLSNFKSKSKIFYTQWIRNFGIDGDLEGFIFQRQNLMNKIKENFSNIFESEISKQLIFNLLQICFVILTEVSPLPSKKADLIDDLFHAACFIVIKLECPEKMAILKEYILENDFDYEAILQAEVLVLNKVSWKIDLITPSEIALNLTNDLFFSLSSESCLNFLNSEAHQYFQAILEFVFSDWDVYLKFDLYTLTISILIFSFELSNFDSFFAEVLLGNITEEDIYNVKNCYEKIKEEIEKSNHCQVNNFNIYSEGIENLNNLDNNYNNLCNSSIAGNLRDIDTNFITEEECFSNYENSDNDNSANILSNLINENVNENYSDNNIKKSVETSNCNFCLKRNEEKCEDKQIEEADAFNDRINKSLEEDGVQFNVCNKNRGVSEERNDFCNKNVFSSLLKQISNSDGESGYDCFHSPILHLKENWETNSEHGKGFFSNQVPRYSHNSTSFSDYFDEENNLNSFYNNRSNYDNSCDEKNTKSFSYFAQLAADCAKQSEITDCSALDFQKNSGVYVKSNQAAKALEFDFNLNFLIKKNVLMDSYNQKNSIPCHLDSTNDWENDVSSDFFLKKKKNFLEEVVISEKPEQEAELIRSYKYEMNSTDEESPLHVKTNSNKFIKNIYKGTNSINNNSNNNDYKKMIKMTKSFLLF